MLLGVNKIFLLSYSNKCREIVGAWLAMQTLDIYDTVFFNQREALDVQAACIYPVLIAEANVMRQS